MHLSPQHESGLRTDPQFSGVVLDVAEAMSIKFNTMVYELKRRGRKVIVMSLGEAYFDLPLFRFDDLPFPDVYHYSHSRGIPELRETIAKYFGSAFGIPVDPEKEILVTAGSKAAIYMALLAILDPGDEVIIPEPAWVSYREQIKLCYGKPIGVPWGISLEEVEGYVTHRTKAIIITTPHNPRGYVYSRAELDSWLRFAERHNLWLLSDEAYSDFVVDGSFVSLGAVDQSKRRGVVFNSISKNLGISGWRLGYVVGNEDLIYEILKINQHLITCPATILQHYVAKHFWEILYATKPQIHELDERRTELLRFMADIGLEHLEGAATFYFFVSIAPTRLTSEEFCTRLLETEFISTVPGIGYGDSCDGYIRVSFGTASVDEIKHGLRMIKALITSTS
jgi:aminotransferase